MFKLKYRIYTCVPYTVYIQYVQYMYMYIDVCEWLTNKSIGSETNENLLYRVKRYKKPTKNLKLSSSFLEFKWKFLHILLWRYQFFTILLIGFSLSFQRLLSFYYWTLWKKAKFSHSSTSFVKFCPMDFLNLRVVFSV